MAINLRNAGRKALSMPAAAARSAANFVLGQKIKVNFSEVFNKGAAEAILRSVRDSAGLNIISTRTMMLEHMDSAHKTGTSVLNHKYAGVPFRAFNTLAGFAISGDCARQMLKNLVTSPGFGRRNELVNYIHGLNDKQAAELLMLELFIMFIHLPAALLPLVGKWALAEKTYLFSRLMTPLIIPRSWWKNIPPPEAPIKQELNVEP